MTAPSSPHGHVPTTRRAGSVAVGDALSPLDVPLTRTLIVAGAIASRDYQIVHHDPYAAVERGSKDVIMNILTTNGFVGRFVTDWVGPAARLRSVKLRLGAPNYPGDTMRLTGRVESIDADVVTVAVTGANQYGNHVVATVEVVLPGAEA
jgi:acyl dehydratase